MTVLIIAEKPSVAADIARVLGIENKSENYYSGNDIEVTWALGHLLQQDSPESCDESMKNWYNSSQNLPLLPDVFKIKPIGGRNRKQLTSIKKLATTNPIRLGLALNFSVFYYECLNDTSKAC